MSMHRLLSITVAALFATVHSPAATNTDFRDSLRKDDPIYEKLWRALEVLPLDGRKQTVLRIYDERTNLTFSASGDRVVIDVIQGFGEAWGGLGGLGKRMKDAEKHLTVNKHQLELVDAGFASDLEYLVSHLDALDTDDTGLDGGYTYFDAISKDGRFTTFEVWSPQPQKHPMTCELQAIFHRIPGFVLDTASSKEDWEHHGYLNFQMGFLNVSSLGLTREVAKRHILDAFKTRIHRLVNALKGI
jgi:hypothetical protein